jgi:cytidyltransferase-related domain
MIIIKTSKGIQDYCQKQKKAGRKTGFVPTMGALHNGHLSLIDHALKTDDLVICSIFVNPSQFNNKEDLLHYPSTIEQDIQSLAEKGCHVLFLPSNEEVYPSDFKKKKYRIGELEHLLEGEYRPGHFQGVCQVMDQLLSFIKPDDLFLGQKDFQQCLVNKKAFKSLTSEWDPCPYYSNRSGG